MRAFFKIPIVVILFWANKIEAQEFKLPAYEKFKLKNGLTVFLMERHEVPLIDLSIIIPIGYSFDGEKSGLANLTAHGLTFGNKMFTREEMSEQLDQLGASINYILTPDYTSLTGKCLAKDQNKMLDLFMKTLTSPTFNSNELDKEKKKLLQWMEQSKESPQDVIDVSFNKALFDKHPYGYPKNGKLSTVRNFQQNDLKQFYSTYYRPEYSAIAISGDFDSKSMRKMIISLFSEWKASNPTPNLAIPIFEKTITKNSILLVNKPDAIETTFYIGSGGVPMVHPDRILISVVNTLFGGRFTSMLNDELRVNSGLTYGASSYFNTLKMGGSFYISTFTANQTTEEAIDKTLSLIHKLHEKGIDSLSLVSAKNYSIGRYPTHYETNEQLCNYLTNMFYYKYDENYINQFARNINDITLEQANAAVSKYFPKNNLQFVIVGKAEMIAPILKKYGELTIIEIADVMK